MPLVLGQREQFWRQPALFFGCRGGTGCIICAARPSCVRWLSGDRGKRRRRLRLQPSYCRAKGRRRMRGWVINLRRLVSLVDHLECHDIKADKILEYSSALDAVTQCFRDGQVPLYPALHATSQNPMIFGQQVPRDIWESHARGFWMKSTSNMESMCLKLVLLFQN